MNVIFYIETFSLLDVKQRWYLVTDFSGQAVGAVFKIRKEILLTLLDPLK